MPLQRVTSVYTISLTTKPVGGNVLIRALSANTASIGVSDTLTFSSTNWDQAQTITITAVEDDNIIDEQSIVISNIVAGADYE